MLFASLLFCSRYTLARTHGICLFTHTQRALNFKKGNRPTTTTTNTKEENIQEQEHNNKSESKENTSCAFFFIV